MVERGLNEQLWPSVARYLTLRGRIATTVVERSTIEEVEKVD